MFPTRCLFRSAAIRCDVTASPPAAAPPHGVGCQSFRHYVSFCPLQANRRCEPFFHSFLRIRICYLQGAVKQICSLFQDEVTWTDTKLQLAVAVENASRVASPLTNHEKTSGSSRRFATTRRPINHHSRPVEKSEKAHSVSPPLLLRHFFDRLPPQLSTFEIRRKSSPSSSSWRNRSRIDHHRSSVSTGERSSSCAPNRTIRRRKRSRRRSQGSGGALRRRQQRWLKRRRR